LAIFQSFGREAPYLAPVCNQAGSGAFRAPAYYGHPRQQNQPKAIAQIITPGTAPFSLDISLEARLRFAGLHDALGFKTKAETFEAIVYAVSTKDKIDPAAIERIERKLDCLLQRLDDSI
jgi:uncharacterized protein (DUF486 family)